MSKLFTATMNKVYLVLLYTGIEYHTEFDCCLGVFTGKDRADKFVETELPKIKLQLDLSGKLRKHMNEWERANPSPDAVGVDISDDVYTLWYNTKYNPELDRFAKEIGYDTHGKYSHMCDTYAFIEVKEAPFDIEF